MTMRDVVVQLYCPAAGFQSVRAGTVPGTVLDTLLDGVLDKVVAGDDWAAAPGSPVSPTTTATAAPRRLARRVLRPMG
ncbi:hypothetical protein JCM9957A_01050 [Kineosporia succinea]